MVVDENMYLVQGVINKLYGGITTSLCFVPLFGYSAWVFVISGDETSLYRYPFWPIWGIFWSAVSDV